MNTKHYFKILVDEIHSVVVATTDENGLPTTRVIDMMLYDHEGIYFLTAKGKVFYKQLMDKGYISLSGMTAGVDSMSKKAISISGSVRNIGTTKLDDIFKHNPYMADIYQSRESREALEVFCLYKGKGDYFDLSTRPITRGNFAFGGKEVESYGYFITDACSECGKCLTSCPTNCIEEGTPYIIIQEHCLHCGNCLDVCPERAITKGDIQY